MRNVCVSDRNVLIELRLLAHAMENSVLKKPTVTEAPKQSPGMSEGEHWDQSALTNCAHDSLQLISERKCFSG